jgi:hypothetical protein
VFEEEKGTTERERESQKTKILQIKRVGVTQLQGNRHSGHGEKALRK